MQKHDTKSTDLIFTEKFFLESTNPHKSITAQNCQVTKKKKKKKKKIT